MAARTGTTRKATKTRTKRAAKPRAPGTAQDDVPSEVVPAPPVVEARGLIKRFGDLVAVDGIDLTVPRGTCFGLLGPNGAGKTTTIKMIDCTSPVDGGTLHVLGMDTRTQRRDIKQRLGLVPQDDNLDPDFTVYKNLTTYARFYGVSGAEARARADRLLTFVSLDDKRDAHINHLSGGMKRRLIVARSLVNDPDILVLDEPTTGLDPQARHTIWDKIRALKREGKTVLLTTHYMDEAEMLCDRLVIIDHGKVIEEGNPRALIKQHTGGQALELVVRYGPESEATLDAIAKMLDTDKAPYERLSDRIIAFGTDTRKLDAKVRRTHTIQESIERRATLEDVFLRLTGRALRD